MNSHFRVHPLDYYGKTPKKVGDGTYSRVYRYKTRRRKGVAVKVHKDTSAFIREVGVMDDLRGCPYIVKLLDMGYDFKRKKFYHVMPLAESDTFSQLRDNFFSENPQMVKRCIYHLLQALCFIHSKQYIHRDIKAENILAFREENGDVTYKLCDFGLTRKSGRGECYTSYMVTLYYRPPENLLDQSDYNQSIDVWSAGCILVELILGIPPFNCRKTKEVLKMQMKAFGHQITDDSSEYLKDAIKDISDVELKEGRDWWESEIEIPILEKGHSEALDLIGRMFQVEPAKRISVRDALNHPYFHSYDPISLSTPSIFEVWQPKDWSSKQILLDPEDVKFYFSELSYFLEDVELEDVVFAKTWFLFHLFAFEDDENHITPNNLWSYILVIARTVSKLCCGDPIPLGSISKSFIRSKVKERTRYFLNKIDYRVNLYTGYDWLIEPSNVNNMRSKHGEGLSSEMWESKVWEVKVLYLASLLKGYMFCEIDPKDVVEACYLSVLGVDGATETQRSVMKILEG